MHNYRWFYDFGTLNNYKAVLGSTIKDWFLPIVPKTVREDNGIEWRAREYDVDAQEQVLRDKEKELLLESKRRQFEENGDDEDSK